MFSKVESYRDSGMSCQAWCNQEGLNKNTFYYWQKRYDEVGQDHIDGEFIEVTTLGSPEDLTTQMTLCYPNGVRLELATSTSPDLLKSLVTIF